LGGKTQEEAHRTRYLLGEGSETERERLEAEFFADDDAFQEMLTAEDDLIDAYARGELSAKEHRQFEERLMTSSQGRERVQFARAFAGAAPVSVAPVATKRQVTSTSWSGFFAPIFGHTAGFRAAVATVSIAAIAGFSYLLVERGRMNNELQTLRAERANLSQKTEELQRAADVERARSAEMTAQLESLKGQVPTEAGRQEDVVKAVKPGSSVEGSKRRTVDLDDQTLASDRGDQLASPATVQFDLNPGSVRGGSGNTFEVPANARAIRLRLTVETGTSAENYRAVIETPEGGTVRRLNSLRTQRHSANDGTHLLTVPAKDLPSGDYILRLSEKSANGVFENIADYAFRVARK